jgi:hypothetical protein
LREDPSIIPILLTLSGCKGCHKHKYTKIRRNRWGTNLLPTL